MDETLAAPSEKPAAITTGTASEEVQNMNKEDEPMPDTEQNDTSSDSDESDSDDEAQQNLQLQTLETELSTNPSNYDGHVQYIKLLRKAGDIEKLRRAREAMSELFPLSPTMWQEWTKDEASLNKGPDAFSAIKKLYERGVFDYLSVSLWCDYITFVLEFDPSIRELSPAGISIARDLFERALTAAGLHVAEGNKIWNTYREFEQAICLTIDETDIQAKERQIQRVRCIFHRQLSVPLVEMQSMLLAYKAWEVEQGNVHDSESNDLDGISSQVASAYKKALEMYNARVHLEEKIASQDISDTERLQLYMNYLKLEQSSATPSRVQVVYERAITELPISSDLWLDYTRYLDRTLKVGNIVSSVYSRATKNCPWIAELWVRYLLSLERGHASEKEIAAVFEKSLLCTFSTLDEYLDLFLTRVDGLRRRISSSGKIEDQLNNQMIRETFKHASDYLSPHLKNTEGLLRLYDYWAHLEIKLGKDLSAARGVFESLLKICGSMFEAWKSYIAMEIELGHINEARAIFKRCYSKRFPGTGSEDICHSWLRFEREFGMLEDFDHALQKVTPRLEELQLFRLQQESNSTEGREISLKRTPREKRKPGSDITDEKSAAKRQKEAAQNPKKVQGKDKVQLQNSSEPMKVEENHAKVNKTDNTTEKQSTSDKTRAYSDQCTAFMSNLNLQG
ncbi:squamous cell carcinoma antigen recognized by T-cells 3-like [Quillaja saponaria]|uniref:Squamous cell carcinoma antigen recognized by T-cells 3-like n=1 Tax=Quillaja saponaria TaxID=32244 RepID=A0AAD7M0X3_QUISA|nr:squamous cell carcinoma antigen recognized by T-cells 3-like [Quillaja saponaria]